ncbi:uncharacterized protein BDZ99DRAFT_516746 [Mytilinidion resinicola]|uniref:Glycosyltransferase 2-like domain-containing protein n=1 Tax=Mytilinidion resinicola TaxID=574789 RepID=A0A6A6Z1H2_9PEZI|nr:uncharacterized protein BDZ99DRAFT_516746 [Mytilinidion resinicola]KAF2814134.1 hypothetical protein BDZ99DRAFT_516746 [Mytilinidion resinicola]
MSPNYSLSSSSGSATGSSSPASSPSTQDTQEPQTTQLEATMGRDTARYTAMVKFLSGKITVRQWLPLANAKDYETCFGVLLRKSRGCYICEPERINSNLLAAVRSLNVEVAFTMSTETTRVIFSTLQNRQTDIRMQNGSQLQIVESLAEIASTSRKVKKFQYGCLVRKEMIALVWYDDLQHIISHGGDFEEKLLALVWGSGGSSFSNSDCPVGTIETTAIASPLAPTFSPPCESKKGPDGISEQVVAEMEEELAYTDGESLGRPVVFTSAVFVGLALLIGLSTSQLIYQAMIDGYWIRLALLAVEPVLLLFGLFFGIIFGDICQAVGPISSVKRNSRFHSAVKPSISRAYTEGFIPPPIVIQLPVYKESLTGVIISTVESLKAAISHYESHGVQHSAGVMKVLYDYFENGIAFFTDMIYSSVKFSIGSGEGVSFVGHNAFLRWHAIQSVGRVGDDGFVTYWSESHVSEDFEISLQLQIAGNLVRLATYHGDEFKEDYALAAGLPLTLLNYILIGWFNGRLDKFYVDSWKIFLALIVVFTFISNIALAILHYRLGDKGFGAAMLENFKWAPMFILFFSDISFHLSLALLAHMFSINMQWGATAKEKENSNFFKEIPKIFKSFKWMYICLIPVVGGMIYLGIWAPRGWQINGATAVVPLAVMVGCHLLLPLLLNPSLMVFNY